MKKKLLLIPIILLVILIALLLYARATLYPQFPIANGYAAKKMCSCTFIAEREQESIQNEDLAFGPLSLTSTKIDRERKQVTTSLFGMQSRTAVHRDDIGCILLKGKDDYNISLQVDRPEINPVVPWPLGDNYIGTDVKGVDYNSLRRAVSESFDASLKMDSLNTRAVVVIYKDTLVMEKYAQGFNKDTEILGWSMTKSITSTLVGMMVAEGKFNLESKSLFDSWTDDRKDITLKDLLQMQSGLQFIEDYAAISDATEMLYLGEDVRERPTNSPLIYVPGTHWYYSSGTTNILSGLLRKHSDSHEAYLRMPYERIFNPLKMNSAIMETDEAGNFIGSSYMYATPRDWAKFGLLYLNDGNWYGDQLVDSSWVNFVRTPSSDGGDIYGGQFWLNANHAAYPDVPSDLYSLNGFQGQYVFIIPSYDAVIVRMGLSEDLDLNHFLSNILSSLEPKAN